MSTLAKIFIVVNLFLTFGYVFLVAALLAQKNDYREKLNEQQKIAEEAIKQRDDAIIAQKQEIEKEKEEILTRLDSLHQERVLSENYLSHKRDLQDQKAEKEAKLPKLEASKGELQQEIDKKEDDNRSLRKVKEELSDWLNQIQEEQTVASDAKGAVQEELRGVYNEVTELAEQLGAAQEAVSKESAGLRNTNLDVNNIRYIGGKSGAKSIDAKIIAVSPSANQVMMNVGESKGVADGTRFLVYRASVLVAEIEVEQTFPEMCAARVISSVPGQKIAEGDGASTKFK